MKRLNEKTTGGSAGRAIGALLLGAGLLVGGAGLATAQTPAEEGQQNKRHRKDMTESEKKDRMQKKIDRRLEKMTRKLDLTEEQQAEIRTIMEDSAAQKLELRQEKKELRRKRRQHRTETFDRIEDVLTNAQKEKARKHFRKRGRQRMERKIERLDQELNLTDQQRAQVEAIFSEARTEMKGLWKNESLDRKAKKRKMREIFRESSGDIEAILDADQREKFEGLKDEFFERKRHRGKHRRGGF